MQSLPFLRVYKPQNGEQEMSSPSAVLLWFNQTDPLDFFLILICAALFFLISAVPAPCEVQPVPGLIKLGSYSLSPTVAPLST